MHQVENVETADAGTLLNSVLSELSVDCAESATTKAARICFAKALSARASHHALVVAYANDGGQLDAAAAASGDTTA